MRISDTIGLVLKNKDRNRVLSIEPDQTVYEALEKMAEYDVGALLVLSNRHWSESCRNVTTRAKEFSSASLPAKPGFTRS